MSVGAIKRFDTIGQQEVDAVTAALWNGPLSGFIASKEDGGHYVTMLEQMWRDRLKVKHAISFNSATSGLLAASCAVDIRGKDFIVTPFTMSATCAAPKFAGGTPVFVDIEAQTYGLDPEKASETVKNHPVAAIFTTNLFGHTSKIIDLRKIADDHGIYLIEDASQAPMATENGHLSGTVGHIGVFSLNVHKHVECGEGGIAVTNDDSLAFRMRCVRNHGENLENGILGLNLRMTEPIAAIACVQMAKLDDILQDRIKLAHALTKQTRDLPGIYTPISRENCRHVYYAWPFLLDKIEPDEFIFRMKQMGVPISQYSTPLYYLHKEFFTDDLCPITDEIYKKLCLFEICTYAPSEFQVRQISRAFKEALTR